MNTLLHVGWPFTSPIIKIVNSSGAGLFTQIKFTKKTVKSENIKSKHRTIPNPGKTEYI